MRLWRPILQPVNALSNEPVTPLASRLGANLDWSFRGRFVGRDMAVLWESSEPFGDANRWSGLTGNYLRVVTEAPTDIDLHNAIEATTILGAIPGALYGRSASSIQSELFAPDPRVTEY